jgi:type I restriction enzyme S subunit
MPVAPVDTRFLAYLFKIPESVTRFYRISQGLVSDTWNLRFSSFAALEFNLPPLSEQQRIVEILDALNTAISASEALIAKTQLLVHSLAEMLVSNNNSAAQEVSLGSLLTRSPRNGFSPKEVEEPTGLYALGLGCLTLDGFELRQLKNVPTGNGPERAALLHDGDLLVSRANTRDLVGLVGIYRDFGSPCIYPDLMMRLVPVTDCRPEYLELAIRSGGVRRQIQAIAQGTSASMVKIGGASIRRIKVAIPPLAEQDRVLEVVAAARGELHVRKSEREKLTQLRVGLMDDLLTGRVRVGEVADIVDRVTC